VDPIELHTPLCQIKKNMNFIEKSHYPKKWDIKQHIGIRNSQSLQLSFETIVCGEYSVKYKKNNLELGVMRNLQYKELDNGELYQQ
jgi:hypothetical protein